MAKKLPEYNASSLADIAFMLLIFFLVTTTMDVDKGLRRKLPPMPPEGQDQNDNKINDRNVFEVKINFSNKLFVEGQPMDVTQLREAAKEFIVNRGNTVEGPEKIDKEIEFFGMYPVAEKAVISLQNDVSTTYGAYIEVNNELTAAYNEVRNELAREKFGKAYDDLDSDRQKAIRKIYPQKISEAEPKKID